MSDFSRCIYVECTASVVCAECGNIEDANGGGEGEAERQLEHILERNGWECIDGEPYCPDCIRKRKEAAKPRRRGRKAAD